MCGRLNISDLAGIRQLMADIGLPLYPSLPKPRFNMPPSSQLLTLAAGQTPPSHHSTWQLMSWGMPLANGPLVINARSETVQQKTLFKGLSKQRALVPCNGFYEWQRQHGQRHAWHFESTQNTPLLLAALWRQSPAGQRQLVLLTTAADAGMAPVHHRMPMAIDSSQAINWLHSDTNLSGPNLSPLRKRRVDAWVDKASNDGPQCLAPPAAAPYTPDLFD